MILPKFADIQIDRGTYYTFNIANTLLTKHLANTGVDNRFYMSHFVAIELPKWEDSKFFYKYRRNTSSPAGDIEHCYAPTGTFDELHTDYTNPNKVIPKLLSTYFENMCRTEIGTFVRSLGDGDDDKKRFKIFTIYLLKFLELLFKTNAGKASVDTHDNSIKKIEDTIYRYIGRFMTQSFIDLNPNNGWQEVIAEIPNNAGYLDLPTMKTKLITTYPNGEVTSTIPNEYKDNSIYDTGDFKFNLTNPVYLNFSDYGEIYKYDKKNEYIKDMRFNVILTFFYDTYSGCHIPHGIYFPSGWVETSLNSGIWELPSYKFTTNTTNSFGYTFKFNTRINASPANRTMILQNQENSFYNTFHTTLNNLNDFLVRKINQK